MRRKLGDAPPEVKSRQGPGQRSAGVPPASFGGVPPPDRSTEKAVCSQSSTGTVLELASGTPALRFVICLGPPVSPVLVTGRGQPIGYRNNVLTVVLGGAAEKNLVLIVECVGKAGSKARPFCFFRLKPALPFISRPVQSWE